jgi:hypothetical protein
MIKGYRVMFFSFIKSSSTPPPAEIEEEEKKEDYLPSSNNYSIAALFSFFGRNLFWLFGKRKANTSSRSFIQKKNESLSAENNISVVATLKPVETVKNIVPVNRPDSRIAELAIRNSLLHFLSDPLPPIEEAHSTAKCNRE